MEDKTILLVEQNSDDQELTRLAFEKHNLLRRLIIANDGVEAIDFLLGDVDAGDHKLPTVVLLDLKLPRMDGLEVLRRIRADKRTKMMPLVVLTSSKEDRDVIATYDVGVNSYIRKLVDFSEFVDAMRQLGLYWLLMNVAPPQEVVHETTIARADD